MALIALTLVPALMKRRVIELLAIVNAPRVGRVSNVINENAPMACMASIVKINVNV